MDDNKKIYYIHFDQLDSTNDWTKQNTHLLDPKRLSCITAAEQTAGRGRYARKWHSPKGQNIYATLYFSLPKSSSIIPNLGQILSLACVETLKKMGFSPQIKWPNDILLEGKKVAGILGEAVSLNDELFGMVLGIGINVDTPQSVLENVGQPATSLSSIIQHEWLFEEILEPMVQRFSDHLQLLSEQGFAPFQPEYEASLAFKGEKIDYTDGKRRVQGICKAIDSLGRLRLLVSKNGHEDIEELEQILTVQSGEIL
jgi:BirA family biotin operon repressor/biotin-[acetyl-CoA-carboxylase] ligase